MSDVRCAPFVIFDGESDEARLYLYSEAMADKSGLFEKYGRESSGHDWANIARQLASSVSENMMEALEFNPEAGMFAVYGPPPVIRMLAARLHSAYHDADLLESLIAESAVH